MDWQLIIVIVVIAWAAVWVVVRFVRSLRHDDDLSCGCGTHHAKHKSVLDQCEDCPVCNQCGKRDNRQVDKRQPLQRGQDTL